MDIRSMILYEDNDIIVCRKEAGLPVQHRNPGVMDLESMLKNYLAAKAAPSSGGKIPYLAVIHRLDQPVEGVIVFALNKKAAAFLSAQMREGLMNKEYLALVSLQGEEPPWSDSPESWHQLKDFMLRDGRTNTSGIVPYGTPGSKEARLSFRKAQSSEWAISPDRALLHIVLDTGRHHQIRVQLSHAGMPIVGDRKYGQAENIGGGSLCLSAFRLTFPHPSDGREMKFEIVPSFLSAR